MRPKEKSNLILVEAAEEARVVVKAAIIIAVVSKHRPTREEMEPQAVAEETVAEAAEMTRETIAEVAAEAATTALQTRALGLTTTTTPLTALGGRIKQQWSPSVTTIWTPG